jgi:hypothetical protein
MNMPIVLTASALVVAALAVTPFMLPAQARVSRSAVIPATPEAIYDVISTTSGFHRINPYRDRDPGLAVTFSGPESGPGAGFAWSGKEGTGTQTISAVTINKEVVMQLDLGQMGQPVQTFTLAPVNGGTKVTWSLLAEFGSNPVARVFGLMLDQMLGDTYERGLMNLTSATAPAPGQASL